MSGSYAEVLLAVAGAHLSGQPLNEQLTRRGALLVETTRTSADYRLYALDSSPAKPGVVRVPTGGGSVEVELWRLAAAAFGDFVASLPQPMAIGKVTLADGRLVCGFLVEPVAVSGMEDITRSGGWRSYLASRHED